MSQYQIQIFADYFQFYLQDEKAEDDLSHSWAKEAVENLLAPAPGTIAIGTVRNMTVPVTVEILDNAPFNDFIEWDHVNECSLDVPTGVIVIAGTTDYFPDAKRIVVAPGMYHARIYYGKLDKISKDGLDGEDHYKISLWRDEYFTPKTLKRR